MRSKLIMAATLTMGFGAGCGRPAGVIGGAAIGPPDTACTSPRPGRRDTISAILYVTTGFDQPGGLAARRFREELLRSIVEHYQMPPRITAPMVLQAALQPGSGPNGLAALPRRSATLSPAPVFDGELQIVLVPDERVSETRVLSAPDSPEIIPALIAALMRAEQAGALPRFPEELRGRTSDVRIRLFGTGSLMPPSVDSSAPVFKVAEPLLEVSRVDVAARAISGSGSPRYPRQLLQSGLQGVVELQFIVDAAGRADVRSVRTLFATHPDFAAAVTDAMPDMRFLPGRVGECSAPSWVRQRFEFRTGD